VVTEQIEISRSELRQQRRKRMADRLAELRSEAFTLQAVAARVPELEGARQPASASEVVWAKATGRLTIRYVFPRGLIVYGKFYDDGLGPRAFDGLRALRQDGFGATSTFQVAEPLHFDEPRNMLLLRQAEGVPLIQSLDHAPSEEAVRHAELAASWLARFHRITLPGVEAEPPCERVKLFKLADSLAKAAAANPHEADLLLNLLQRLRELAPSPDARTPFATVHGQYTPANVFVSGSRATVIDLDRVCHSDPAMDVAMFLYRVRHHSARSGAFERASAIAASFLAQYRDQAAGNLINLNFYRALYCLKGLSRFLKVPQAAGEAYEQQKQFYLREFDELSPERIR
jgi:Phosphotransferase enzyme family